MKRVPQVRFNLWLESYEEYNCSAAGDVNWTATGVPQPIFGTICIIFGAVTIPCYAFCAVIMWRLRALSVYKIMCYLAVADICELLVNSIAFGIMEIQGEVYCMNPSLHLLFSMAAIFTFFCSTITCMLLALNRFGELLSIKWIIRFFEGRRTYRNLLISIPCGLFIVLFTPPMLFNSKFHLVLFDPLIIEDKYQYVNYFHVVGTVLLPFLSTVIYIVMLIALFVRHGKISKSERSSTLNKAALRATNCFNSYSFFQFVPTTEGLLYFTHVGWMLVHGSPPYVYFIFNSAVRGRIGQLLKKGEASVFAVSQTPTVALA